MVVLDRSTCGSVRVIFLWRPLSLVLFNMERAYAIVFLRYNMGSGRRYFYSPGLNDGT